MARVATIEREEAAKPGKTNNGAAEEPKVSFFDRLRQLPEEAWETHRVYIYRRWPRISRSDQPHYVACVRQPIDEPWLLEHYGSGRYGIRLNDRKRTLESFVAEVHSLEHPPKLKPEELVDCPENERYFELWPEAKKAVAEAAEGGSSDAAATAVREIGRLAREAQQRPAVDKTLADLYLQTAAARDALVDKLADAKPGADVLSQVGALDKILGLVERLQGKNTEPRGEARPSEQVTMMKELIGLFRDMQQAVPKGNPAPTLFGQLNEFGTAVKNLRETFAPPATEAAAAAPTTTPAGEPIDWWDKLLRTPSAAAIAGPVGEFVKLWLTAKALGLNLAPSPTAVPGATGPSPLPGATASPPSSSSPAAARGAANMEPPPMPTEQSSTLSPEEQVRQATARQVFPYVVQALTDGVPGDALAESVFTMNKLAYTQLRAYGEEGLLQLLKSTPDVWAPLQSLEAQLRELIQNFVAWGAEDTQGQEPEPNAAPETSRHRAKADKALN